MASLNDRHRVSVCVFGGEGSGIMEIDFDSGYAFGRVGSLSALRWECMQPLR